MVRHNAVSHRITGVSRAKVKTLKKYFQFIQSTNLLSVIESKTTAEIDNPKFE